MADEPLTGPSRPEKSAAGGPSPSHDGERRQTPGPEDVLAADGPRTPPRGEPPAGFSARRPALALSLVAGLGLLGILLAVLFPAAEPVTATRIMMDTLVTVKAWGTPEAANGAVEDAFRAMDEVDRLASCFRSESEVSRLNLSGGVVPGATLAALLARSDWAWKVTGGVFDPTFSVLHQAWGFYDRQGPPGPPAAETLACGPPQGRGRQPDPSELRACLERVGWGRQVGLSRAGVSLASGARIDLGGIAGGFALEMARVAMRAHGCVALFLDDGGDLWMEGTKPDGRPWRVAVRDPRDDGVLAVIENPGPIAVSTSGDYERFVLVGNRRIGHILDPRTGQPADHYRSVTVVASSPLEADVWSTALFAMPPAVARAMAEREKLPALFLPASGPSWMSTPGPAWFGRVKP